MCPMAGRGNGSGYVHSPTSSKDVGKHGVVAVTTVARGILTPEARPYRLSVSVMQ